ncbi:HAD family hydrolase [Paenibacillus taihuensis]|uniref:HAD family hydrolase n=1 Tax=Paenibacillus taihuensis TaxID=1156355 RepID=UPI003CCC626B
MPRNGKRSSPAFRVFKRSARHFRHPCPQQFSPLAVLHDIRRVEPFPAAGVEHAMMLGRERKVVVQRARIIANGIFRRNFDCILIEEEFGHGKPDHFIYQHALNQLDTCADETWMVGDNYEWEIDAPQQLGIRGIWVNPSGEARRNAEVQPAPFRTIRALCELRAILADQDSQ